MSVGVLCRGVRSMSMRVHTERVLRYFKHFAKTPSRHADWVNGRQTRTSSTTIDLSPKVMYRRRF